MNTTTERAALYWLHALTPLRIGGDPGLGAINLPTLREQHTGHPIVPGSSVKGVLRAALSHPGGPDARALFGPDRDHASDHRGALVFTDATLLALPVRSLWGTFAWCTSRLCLRRLDRDRQTAGLAPLPRVHDGEGVRVAPGSALLFEGQVFIEEQSVAAKDDPAVALLGAKLAAELWPDDTDAQSFFTARLAVLPDDALNALALISLEVRARVCLDADRGTAAASGPWLEESMPAETILSGLTVGRTTWVYPQDTRPEEGMSLTAEDALDMFGRADALKGVLTFGGNTSVGYGRAALRLVHAKTTKGA